MTRRRWMCLWVSFGVMLMQLCGPVDPAHAAGDGSEVVVTIAPAAMGAQLVRVSVPLPKGFLAEGQGLVARVNGEQPSEGMQTAVRALTWYPHTAAPRFVRRALVTFPYTFSTAEPVRLVLTSAPAVTTPARFRVQVRVYGDTVRIAYRGGPVVTARLMAPARTSTEKATTEAVESNAFYRWQRTRVPASTWPRVIEVRADALGGVAVIAHVQRNVEGDAYAPDLGWDIEVDTSAASLRAGEREVAITEQAVIHSFAEGAPCELFFDGAGYRVYHPTATLKRRGRVEANLSGTGVRYRYLRCTADEKVPMQQAAWQRVEFVIAPAGLAPLTPTLQSPHQATIDWRLWDELYDIGSPLDLSAQPELNRLLQYHHDAIVRGTCRGDDWGNVTSYADGSDSGAVFGMNRLNHCSAIFEEGWRSGDRRLVEAALLWCDNFFDQSVWWGPGETGGTRYNNLIAMGRTPPDNDQSYMWRSNSAVTFCTKGFDSFFMAYEETGDPRMMEALTAQVAYAAKYVHVDTGEARNIGDVRDFVRLYEFTGEQRYLDEALRLFRELRAKLSAGDLFSQSGDPIEPDPPYIDDDALGYRHPFAKPYIIGYGLSGPPELMRFAPGEPKLREMVQAVADFLADSQDPIGGWRYPHPRSSFIIMSQAMEHAEQIMQADLALGVQEKHLDAIERVLRQRILGWRKTGRIFNGLNGWEVSTSAVKARTDLQSLYRRPVDRDSARDYTEGQPDFGSSQPDGLVYFPDVLRFYLQHRPASRLFAPSPPGHPLAQVLSRVNGAPQ